MGTETGVMGRHEAFTSLTHRMHACTKREEMTVWMLD
jgi:hypothetical protein